MEDNDLDRLLEQLRTEIAHAKSVDEKERESLRQLDADIHRLLQGSAEQRRSPEPEMLSGWEDAVEELELEHPTLTRLLSQILNTLSSSGL
jgi:hypothetical protein